MTTIQEVRNLFPDREFPSDEEVQQRIEAVAAEHAAAVESKKQSLRDQLANLQQELDSLENAQG